VPRTARSLFSPRTDELAFLVELTLAPAAESLAKAIVLVEEDQRVLDEREVLPDAPAAESAVLEHHVGVLDLGLPVIGEAGFAMTPFSTGAAGPA
jgi:hypothetical protein